ncbi:MAG: hypothetical protein HRU70_15230 [Phycisphaeraceae bacterium]|nr:MAG: hypothetical protein HRU70_15230 [Phycisphaeraceae bacterium]
MTDPRPEGAQATTAGTMRSPCAPAEVLRRLAGLSKRGKLPGFAPDGERGFRASVFGAYFDFELLADLRAHGEGTVLTWRIRAKAAGPVIFAAVCAFTVWPGVWLTDRLIPGEWGWIETWIWYIPLTVLPLPWAWRKAWRASRESAVTHAAEVVSRVRGEIDGNEGGVV